MTLSYLRERFFKKLPGAAIANSKIEKTCGIGAQSTVVNTTMGGYSYCGYYCKLIHCHVGKFCSIADYVSIGLAPHPTDWVSTSPAFHFGRGSIPKNLASLDYHALPPKTTIGNDVWIGEGVFIKPGITIGNGAIIGMGSIVTKDVPSYAIVAGNPAQLIRMRFPEELCCRLEASAWWDRDSTFLKTHSSVMNQPEEFLRILEEDF